MSSISILKNRKSRPGGARGPMDGLFGGGELSLCRFSKLKCGQKKVLPVYWADMVKDLGRCGQGAQHGNCLVKAFNACVVAGECWQSWRLFCCTGHIAALLLISSSAASGGLAASFGGEVGCSYCISIQ